MNGNENIRYQKLHDSVKAIFLREKFGAVKTHINKEGDILAILSNAAMNMGVQIPLQDSQDIEVN